MISAPIPKIPGWELFILLINTNRLFNGGTMALDFHLVYLADDIYG